MSISLYIYIKEKPDVSISTGVLSAIAMLFIGHFHSTVNTPSAVVNGSIIGYNAFALTNGFLAERPSQQMIVYDTELGGQLLTRQIYCDK